MPGHEEPAAKKAPGGPRRKGIPRPDPAAAKPRYRLWAELACRMYDDLYSHREPGNRPGSNELAVRAHVAQSLVSGFFNGKKNISWETCQALVEALDGDPAVWGPLWRETDQRYRHGLRLGEFAPLPGDGGTGSRIPIADRSVADWAGHSHLPTLRVLRAVVAALAVLGGIAALTLYTFLLGHLRYGRYADAGLMIAALAGWWWWHRTRKSNTSERGRRGLLKKVLSRAQTIAAWADVGLYLPPAFTVPPRRPASARKKAELTGDTFRGTARELYERAGEDLVLLGEPGLGKTTQLGAC